MNNETVDSIININLSLPALISVLDKYDMNETMFQVPADIYCHASNTKSLSKAIEHLQRINDYWSRQSQSTLFRIWNEARMKVWNGKEYVFKLVVKITATNEKINDFSPLINSPLD